MLLNTACSCGVGAVGAVLLNSVVWGSLPLANRVAIGVSDGSRVSMPGAKAASYTSVRLV